MVRTARTALPAVVGRAGVSTVAGPGPRAMGAAPARATASTPTAAPAGERVGVGVRARALARARRVAPDAPAATAARVAPTAPARPTQGAWATPTVVVRRPDGAVVTPAGRPARPVAVPVASADLVAPRRGLPAYGARRPSVLTRAPAPVPVIGTGVGSRSAAARGQALAPGTHGAVTARPSGRVPAVRVAPAPATPASPTPPASTTPPTGGHDDDTLVEALEAPAPGAPDETLDAGDGVAADEPVGGATVTMLRPLAGVGGAAASRLGQGGTTAAEKLRAAKEYGVARLLPTDEDAREARNARLRKAGMRVGSVAVAGVLVYAVFPVRTYLDQRAATRRAHEQIEVIGEQNEELEEQVELLGTEGEIERIARDQYGLVRPGEESYPLLPPPETAPPTTAP